MNETPQLLLSHHLKALRLPTFLREYNKLARRIREARFPMVKSLDSFDFMALPILNKALVDELARYEYIMRREIIIAVGNSGTGKTHIALGLGLAACQKGLSVAFVTASALVHELLEARDDKRLLRLQKQLAGYKLLIIDELGFVRYPRLAQSCCSKSSANVMSEAPSW